MASLVGDVIFRSTATKTEHHLLMILAWYNEQYGDQAGPSIERLAKHIGRTIQHTFTLIKHLEANDHLNINRVKEPGKRPRNYYKVLSPGESSTTKNTAQMNINISAPIYINKDKEKSIPPKICINKCAVKTDLTAEDNHREVGTSNAPPTPPEKPEVTRGETRQETPSSASPIPFPERPSDTLARLNLDATTKAELQTEALALLESEGAKREIMFLEAIHSYMLKLWEVRQKASHEGAETRGSNSNLEEGQAHSATQAA